MLWAVPLGIALLLALPVVVALRRVVEEARGLQRAMRSFGELALPIQDARLEAERFARRVPELRERARPSATSAP